MQSRSLFLLLAILILTACAAPRPPATVVTISEVDYAIGDEHFGSREELAAALVRNHAGLVSLHIVGKPAYRQVQQAVAAVRDAGGRLGMTGSLATQ